MNPNQHAKYNVPLVLPGPPPVGLVNNPVFTACTINDSNVHIPVPKLRLCNDNMDDRRPRDECGRKPVPTRDMVLNLYTMATEVHSNNCKNPPINIPNNAREQYDVERSKLPEQDGELYVTMDDDIIIMEVKDSNVHRFVKTLFGRVVLLFGTILEDPPRPWGSPTCP